MPVLDPKVLTWQHELAVYQQLILYLHLYPPDGCGPYLRCEPESGRIVTLEMMDRTGFVRREIAKAARRRPDP
jgi:hypothetical protein